ncbi:unnamed protein product, partial [Pocillopora meandrina]
AVEALLATTHVATSVENLGTGLKTADSCSGQEVTSFPTTILTLDSPTTSQPEAIHLNTNQSSEELAQVEEIVQKYELESGQSLTVKGNLKKNLGFWRSIGAPNFILTIIEKGYKLPFASLLLAVRLKNNKSARLHANFVDQAVLELVNSGRVCRVDKQPFIVNHSSVSIQPCGKKRLILDLRHDKEGCLLKAQTVRQDLYGAGFVVKEEKSVWEPTQILDWLERRITKITNTIDRIIEADFKLSARALASFTGQIISTAPVVGNIGRIMTRHCVMSTLCVDNWDSVFCLDDYCKEELYFWKDNL